MGVKEQWRQLAPQLGFEFKEGIEALLESPSLLQMAGGALNMDQVAKARNFMDHPMVKKLIAMVFMGAATGFHRGFEFALLRGSSSSSSTKSYHVHISLLFHQSLQCELNIAAGGFLASIGRALFPGSHLKIDHRPELNRMLSIKADDRERALMFLSRFEVQEALMALYSFSRQFTISDHGIRYKEPGHIIDAGRALNIMNLMVDAAEKF